MLINNPLKHFIDEPADIRRNPFSRMTRIDCDKLFSSEIVKYDDALLATRRRDVCEELYDAITAELEQEIIGNAGASDKVRDEMVKLEECETRMIKMGDLLRTSEISSSPIKKVSQSKKMCNR